MLSTFVWNKKNLRNKASPPRNKDAVRTCFKTLIAEVARPLIRVLRKTVYQEFACKTILLAIFLNSYFCIQSWFYR